MLIFMLKTDVSNTYQIYTLDFKYTQPDVWKKEISYSLSENSEWNNLIILYGKQGFL